MSKILKLDPRDQNFGYDKVMNMRALHSVLDMPKYALTVF